MSWYTLQSELPFLQPLLTPSYPPRCLSFQKAKKSQQGIKVNTTSAGQWVCAYIGENDRGPKWWREFQCLFQHPGDSPIQRLACQQATAFWLPTAQQKKDGWWTAPPCLEVSGQRTYLPPKDFHGTFDY